MDARGCERLHRALIECHRRVPSDLARASACRHLNSALAQCLVSEVCPDESEAVRSLCASGGTALKRSQCRQAQLDLSVCLASHQRDGSSSRTLDTAISSGHLKPADRAKQSGRVTD